LNVSTEQFKTMAVAAGFYQISYERKMILVFVVES